MKVLVAHNRYASDQPSGENQVVDAEIELLEKSGVDVVTHIESSDSLKGAGPLRMAEAAVGPVYAPRGVARFRSIIGRERPDVVHVHNTSPLLSPWIIRVARDAGIPVVQTVHAYRHTCVNGLHFRDGHSCTDCLTAGPLSAVKNGCYRGSKAQTAPVMIGQIVHRPTWRSVSRFLALTPFMARSLERVGIHPSQITLRPSWVPDAGPTAAPGSDVLFVGRLDEAKGVRLLLESWESSVAPGRVLRIAGDGPLKGLVEEAARRRPESVRFEGYVNEARVQELMDRSAVVVVPSLWFEGYPLAIARAFERGRAVLTTTGGAAESIVGSEVGWATAPDPGSLSSVLSSLDPADIAAKGRAARDRYLRENSPESALERMMRVYEEVTGCAR